MAMLTWLHVMPWTNRGISLGLTTMWKAFAGRAEQYYKPLCDTFVSVSTAGDNIYCWALPYQTIRKQLWLKHYGFWFCEYRFYVSSMFFYFVYWLFVLLQALKCVIRKLTDNQSHIY